MALKAGGGSVCFSTFSSVWKACVFPSRLKDGQDGFAFEGNVQDLLDACKAYQELSGFQQELLAEMLDGHFDVAAGEPEAVSEIRRLFGGAHPAVQEACESIPVIVPELAQD